MSQHNTRRCAPCGAVFTLATLMSREQSCPACDRKRATAMNEARQRGPARKAGWTWTEGGAKSADDTFDCRLVVDGDHTISNGEYIGFTPANGWTAHREDPNCPPGYAYLLPPEPPTVHPWTAMAEDARKAQRKRALGADYMLFRPHCTREAYRQAAANALAFLMREGDGAVVYWHFGDGSDRVIVELDGAWVCMGGVWISQTDLACCAEDVARALWRRGPGVDDAK